MQRFPFGANGLVRSHNRIFHNFINFFLLKNQTKNNKKGMFPEKETIPSIWSAGKRLKSLQSKTGGNYGLKIRLATFKKKTA